jgi:hypothetical protein
MNFGIFFQPPIAGRAVQWNLESLSIPLPNTFQKGFGTTWGHLSVETGYGGQLLNQTTVAAKGKEQRQSTPFKCSIVRTG